MNGERRRTCPQCHVGTLEPHRDLLFCEQCGSLYQHPSVTAALFSKLRKQYVEPVSDLSDYPTVAVKYESHCDCNLREAIERPGGGQFGPHYCPKHNVIFLETFFLDSEEQKSIPEVIVQVIVHETLHWVLCKDFGESVSAGLDEIADDPSIQQEDS